MKTLRFVVWAVALSLALGGTPLLVPEDAAAEALRVNKRVDARQDRRGDRRENTVNRFSQHFITPLHHNVGYQHSTSSALYKAEPR